MLDLKKNIRMNFIFFVLVLFPGAVSFAGCFVSATQTQEACARICGRPCRLENGIKGNGWRAIDFVQPKKPLSIIKPVK